MPVYGSSYVSAGAATAVIDFAAMRAVGRPLVSGAEVIQVPVTRCQVLATGAQAGRQ